LKNFKSIQSIFLPLILVFLFTGKTLALSIEDEKKMGEAVFQQVAGQFELVDDDYTQEYIEDLGKHLVSALETQHFAYHFHIINDPNLNAFASPGGHIFIYSGLIEIMDNADELAGVLCHELAHSSARHISQRIEQNKKIGLASLAGILAGILIGGKAAGVLTAGSAAAGIQAQLHYSRNDERQADLLGFKYAQASGFDASGLEMVLKKIQQHQLGLPDQVPPYLLTHPSGPERMANIEIMAKEVGPVEPDRLAERIRNRFPYFKTILKAKCLAPEIAEESFKNHLADDPENKLALFGLGLIYQRELRFPDSIDCLQKALSQDPESVPLLKSLGETYQMKGDHEKAVDVLEKARRLDGEDESTIFLLALSHLELEHYSEAIRLLEKLTFRKPVKNQVYYQLGLAYGRQNIQAWAHYYFGVFFKKEMNRSAAIFHFNKAKEMAAGNRELLEQIGRETEGLGRPKPGPG